MAERHDLSPAQQQVREWFRHPPAGAICILQNVLGEGFMSTMPGLQGHAAIVRVVVKKDCVISLHEKEIRCRLDAIGWEWVTLSMDQSKKVTNFGMTQIQYRQPTIAYHTTLKDRIHAILNEGLFPGSSAIRQTDYPDTEGRVHVSESLEGDGSAVRWVRLFSEKYSRPQRDYGILEVDLRGFDGRMYDDTHSQFGVVIDRIDCIPPQRLRLVDESEYTLEEAKNIVDTGCSEG